MSENSVLIIDDDIWMQRILAKTFENFGFTTYLASNGIEGIAIAVENNPKLILCDILMPELSGHLTLRILKQIKATRQIPVLMVSALADTENLGMAVKSGTAGFVSKPFTRATIFEKLINIFGKRTLDIIAKGDSGEFSKEISFETAPASQTAQKLNEIKSVLSNKATETADNKAPAQQEQLLQHYQDDEKRSIESIKQLLLKTKK